MKPEEMTKQIARRQVYRCTSIIPGTMDSPPIEVFHCGKCLKELKRYPLTGYPKTMELITEEHCGEFWEVW